MMNWTSMVSLMTWRHKCLKGAAKRACEQLYTVQQIHGQQLVTYGRPEAVFERCKRRIMELGKCNGTLEKRRDWLNALKSRLADLEKLADKHHMLMALHHSTVAQEMFALLPKEYQGAMLKFMPKDEPGSYALARLP